VKFVATTKVWQQIFFAPLSFVAVFGSGISKNQDLGSGINISDLGYGINISDLGYGINIPDPQHCWYRYILDMTSPA
jgi:hypothetical protein